MPGWNPPIFKAEYIPIVLLRAFDIGNGQLWDWGVKGQFCRHGALFLRIR